MMRQTRLGSPFGTMFQTRHAAPLARVSPPSSPPPEPPLRGYGGDGGGFGQGQEPEVDAARCPECPTRGVSWIWIPLGVAGVVQAMAWIVSRK